MSRTSAHSSRARQRGFTLVEVLVATSVSAIIFAGILTSYLFVGRNLTRLVNLQRQEVESRRALRYVTQDVSAAITLTTATASQLALTKPTAGGTTAVSYSYSSGSGTLTRTDSTGTQTLLSGLSAFTITYYNEGGTAVSSSTQSVKSIEVTFTSTAGSSNSGTLAAYSTVSPRVILRNKQVLQ
jgi:prepilin-type N-terminal cleavage/methylation domain-containing protein